MVLWIRKNCYHRYEKIDIMDTNIIDITDAGKLVSWIQKKLYHEYGKIHIIDTKYWNHENEKIGIMDAEKFCLLYTSPSPRDKRQSRMPSSA